MSELEEKIIQELQENAIDGISWYELSVRMNERQEEFDKEVKAIEQLDIEAQQKAMTYFVR